MGPGQKCLGNARKTKKRTLRTKTKQVTKQINKTSAKFIIALFSGSLAPPITKEELNEARGMKEPLANAGPVV